MKFGTVVGGDSLRSPERTFSTRHLVEVLRLVGR